MIEDLFIALGSLAIGAFAKPLYEYLRPKNPEALAAGEPPYLRKCHIRIVNGESFHSYCGEGTPFDPGVRSFPPKTVVKETAHWVKP